MKMSWHGITLYIMSQKTVSHFYFWHNLAIFWDIFGSFWTIMLRNNFCMIQFITYTHLPCEAFKPNTYHRRRRDETVESRCVGGVYMNKQLVGDSFVVSSVWTHPSAVTHWLQNCKLAADGCVVRSNPSAVVANSCTHRQRDATRQNSFVSSASAVCIGLYLTWCNTWHDTVKLLHAQTPDFIPPDFRAPILAMWTDWFLWCCWRRFSRFLGRSIGALPDLWPSNLPLVGFHNVLQENRRRVLFHVMRSQ